MQILRRISSLGFIKSIQLWFEKYCAIKNYINSGYVKLIPSKICTARKRVAEQKFAGQRLLPGH